MSLEDLFTWLCLGASVIPLYKGFRIHYFESPSRWSRFFEWVEQSYPEAWALLPTWERKYLNPRFGVQRLRREKLVIDPEFDRRLAELTRADWEELRLILMGAAFVLLGLTPHLLRRLLE